MADGLVEFFDTLLSQFDSKKPRHNPNHITGRYTLRFAIIVHTNFWTVLILVPVQGTKISAVLKFIRLRYSKVKF